MNHAMREHLQESAISRSDQTPSLDRVSGSRWRRALIEARRTLYGEYAAMLLAMNAGFAGVVWVLRSLDSPAAAGLAVSCLWVCLRSMHVEVRGPVGLIGSSSAVLFCGTAIMANWVEAPAWLQRSPVSPMSVALMASIILVADFVMRGTPFGSGPACDSRRSGTDRDA